MRKEVAEEEYKKLKRALEIIADGFGAMGTGKFPYHKYKDLYD